MNHKRVGTSRLDLFIFGSEQATPQPLGYHIQHHSPSGPAVDKAPLLQPYYERSAANSHKCKCEDASDLLRTIVPVDIANVAAAADSQLASAAAYTTSASRL